MRVHRARRDAKIKEDRRGTLVEDLKVVDSVCNEKSALGANTIETLK